MRRAVAALVQPVPGGVDAQGNLVLHNGELNLIQCAGFGKPVHMIPAFQPLDHGLFDDLLAVGNGEEPGVETVTLDRKDAVGGDEILPGQGLCPFEQFVKAFGLKGADLDEHTFADAQTDIGAGELRITAREIDTAVFRAHVGDIQPFQFVRDRPLKAEKAGDTHFIVHSFSFKTIQQLLPAAPE